MNQILQAKYPNLEVSVFNYKKVREHFIFGSDFNSNKKENALKILKSENKVGNYFELLNQNISSLKEPAFVYDLTHSIENFMEEVKLSSNIQSNKKMVFAGDFVISRLRSYLKEMAVIQPKNYKQLLSTEYLVYRPKTDEISSNTLMVFALTRYVQAILNCSQYGTEHPRFYEFAFNELPLPDVLFKLNSKIDALMQKAYNLRELSNGLYDQAENELTRYLNIDTKQEIGDSIAIKPFLKSFGKTGRLDAEYYQPKHDKIIQKLRAFGTIGDKCTIYDKTYMPQDDKEYAYIELADIGRFGKIINAQKLIGSQLPSRARRLIKKGNILVSSIEGSLDSCALVDDRFDNALCSTGFYVIDSAYYNSETLLILLKSKPIQSLLKKSCSGTILTSIRKEDFLNIALPFIDGSIQEAIKEKVEKSFKLRNKSNLILDHAKQTLEIAIEQGENIAIHWLETKIKLLNINI
jgi:hypothetical protein